MQAAVKPAWRCPSGRPLHYGPGPVSGWFPAFTGQDKDCEQSWAAVAPLHQPSSAPKAGYGACQQDPPVLLPAGRGS